MIVCPDDLLMKDGRYEWSLSGATEAHRKCHEEWQRVLREERPERAVLMIGTPGSGKSTWAKTLQNCVVFDATLNLPYKRRPLVQMAHAARVEVSFVLMLTPLHICLDRNKNRSEDRRIPEQIIKEMDRKIRTIPPVKLKENYQELVVVRTTDSGVEVQHDVEHRPYKFRGLPITACRGDSLWGISGEYATEGGDTCGILEWAYDESDARNRLERMKQDLTLTNLRVYSEKKK